MKLAAEGLAALIRAYQWVLRPMLAPSCRFSPSCSEYAIEALRTHGVIRGIWLASWRILRCNPFVPGGYDPVPAAPASHDDGHGCSHPKPSRAR